MTDSKTLNQRIFPNPPIVYCTIHMLAVTFLDRPFIKLRKFSCIPGLLRLLKSWMSVEFCHFIFPHLWDDYKFSLPWSVNMTNSIDWSILLSKTHHKNNIKYIFTYLPLHILRFNIEFYQQILNNNFHLVISIAHIPTLSIKYLVRKAAYSEIWLW